LRFELQRHAKSERKLFVQKWRSRKQRAEGKNAAVGKAVQPLLVKGWTARLDAKDESHVARAARRQQVQRPQQQREQRAGSRCSGRSSSASSAPGSEQQTCCIVPAKTIA
jgi:hypothetical protein